MLSPHAVTQQKIVDFINTLPCDADISAPQFFHLVGDHKSVVNKSLRKLALKGYIVFDRTVPPSRGGQHMNVYKKASAPQANSFEFGLIKDGVFADLFMEPYPCSHALEVRRLTGDDDNGKL